MRTSFSSVKLEPSNTIVIVILLGEMGCELGMIQLWAAVRIPPNDKRHEAVKLRRYFVSLQFAAPGGETTPCPAQTAVSICPEPAPPGHDRRAWCAGPTVARSRACHTDRSLGSAR